MKHEKQTVPPVKAANRCPTKSAGALPVDLYGAGRPLPDFNPSGPIPYTVPAVKSEELAWVIQAERETCPETGEPLFWNNADGWGDVATADRFTYGEKLNLRLPMGGKWFQLERGNK